MASNAEERRALLEAYPPVADKDKSDWIRKVNKMSDAQVHAMYMRLKSQKVIK